jgi:hypothetical protein
VIVSLPGARRVRLDVFPPDPHFCKPFQIDGYKLFVLIDRLDDVGHPFCVVPVPFREKSANTSRYHTRLFVSNIVTWHQLSLVEGIN